MPYQSDFYLIRIYDFTNDIRCLTRTEMLEVRISVSLMSDYASQGEHHYIGISTIFTSH